jgi:hypothetical protein
MTTQATTAFTRSAPTTPLPAGTTAASLDEFPTAFSLASLSPPVVTVPRADTDTGTGMGTGMVPEPVPLPLVPVFSWYRARVSHGYEL